LAVGFTLVTTVGMLDSAFETTSQHLVVSAGELANHRVRQTLMRRRFQILLVRQPIHPPYRDIFLRCHLETHKVLKDHPNVAV